MKSPLRYDDHIATLGCVAIRNRMPECHEPPLQCLLVDAKLQKGLHDIVPAGRLAAAGSGDGSREPAPEGDLLPADVIVACDDVHRHVYPPRRRDRRRGSTPRGRAPGHGVAGPVDRAAGRHGPRRMAPGCEGGDRLGVLGPLPALPRGRQAYAHDRSCGGSTQTTDRVLGKLENPAPRRQVAAIRPRRRTGPVRQDRQLHRPERARPPTPATS